VEFDYVRFTCTSRMTYGVHAVVVKVTRQVAEFAFTVKFTEPISKTRQTSDTLSMLVFSPGKSNPPLAFLLLRCRPWCKRMKGKMKSRSLWKDRKAQSCEIECRTTITSDPFRFKTYLSMRGTITLFWHRAHHCPWYTTTTVNQPRFYPQRTSGRTVHVFFVRASVRLRHRLVALSARTTLLPCFLIRKIVACADTFRQFRNRVNF